MKYKKLIEEVLGSIGSLKHEPIVDKREEIDKVLNKTVDDTVTPDELILILRAVKRVWKKVGIELLEKEIVKKPEDAIKLILEKDDLIMNAGLYGICPKLNELITSGKNKKIVKEYLMDNSDRWFTPDPINAASGRGKDILDH